MPHGRPARPTRGRSLFRGSALAILAALTATVRADGDPRDQSPEPNDAFSSAWADDAELFDVHFIDRRQGWAVGQHGVVWHTSDAGSTWQLQHFSRGCRLNSVYFASDQVGWVVGGMPRPFPIPFAAVVLRTQDGGAHWQLEPRLALPLLKKVKFTDRLHGIAAGVSSPLFPSGIAVTDDGGRNWSPAPIEGGLAADIADFRDERDGVIADEHGKLFAIRRYRAARGEVPASGIRRIRDLKLTKEVAWAVGDGGLLLRSDEGGHRWTDQSDQLLDWMADFDWATVAAAGSGVWIAGSPGTCIVYSPDQGQSWQVRPSGQSLPINRLFFSDEHQGWAVGPLGTILSTADGGATWRVSRAGGAFPAWLAIYSDPAATPLELIAKVAGSEGNLGAVRYLCRRDLVAAPAAESQLPIRAAQMLALLGGSRAEFCWQFPIRERGLTLPTENVVDNWSRLLGRGALDALEQNLLRAILTWRPEVIFTPAANEADSLDTLINRAVINAAQRAGAQPRLSDPFAQARLQPWRVKRIYATTATTDVKSASVYANELAPRLGTTLDEFAALPKSVLERAASSHTGFVCQLIDGADTGTAARGDLFGGISPPPGNGRRRRIEAAEAASHSDLLRASRRARNVQAILHAMNHQAVSGANIVGQLEGVIQELTGSASGRLLYELAEQYWQSGRWDVAREIYELLGRRFPNHPFAALALLRLLDLGTSSEAWQRFRDSPALLNPARADTLAGSTDARVYSGVIQATAVKPAETTHADNNAKPDSSIQHRQQLLQMAQAVAAQLEQIDAAIYSEPFVRFRLARAQQEIIHSDTALRYYGMLSVNRAMKAWSTNAAAELWRIDPKESCPKSIFRCQAAAEPPELDGVHDDDCWQTAEPIALRSPYRDDEAWPATVQLAYDRQFLYLAARCHTATPADRTLPTTRAHDADLSAHDRLVLDLDLDRDYASYYQFAVDDRGLTSEECLGDRSWNPRWFVASAADEGAWSIEVAIPWEALCDPAPVAGAIWAIGLERLVPARGFQSATMPAAPIAQPEGFGWLQFD